MGTGSLSSHSRRQANILKCINAVKKNLSLEELKSGGLVYNFALNYASIDLGVTTDTARDYAKQTLALLIRGPIQISIFGEKQDAYATKPQQNVIQNMRDFIERNRESDVIPVEEEGDMPVEEILEKNMPTRKEAYEKEHELLKEAEVDSEIQVET